MKLATTALTPPVLRDVYGRFPSGVVAVCASVDSEPLGFVASTFVAVSLDPPLVSFCVQNDTETWQRFASAPHVGISVLSDTQNVAARSLARRTGDRFEGMTVSTTDEGAVFVDGASAWLDVTVTQEVPAGDHAIEVLRVNAAQIKDGVEPIIFHSSMFRRLSADLISS